jgi:hypothetical protein
MVVWCPVGVSASCIVIEARVCGSDSVGMGRAVLWQVQCNMSRSRSNGEDIMVVWCPVSVSVLCVVTDPACQSHGQPYNVLEHRDIVGCLLLPVGKTPGCRDT